MRADGVRRTRLVPDRSNGWSSPSALAGLRSDSRNLGPRDTDDPIPTRFRLDARHRAGRLCPVTSRAPSPAAAAARMQQFRAAPVPSLCATYLAAGTSLEDRLRLEAELARRGTASCEGAAIGRQSAALLGTPRWARTGGGGASGALAPGQDRDCADLPGSAAAQVFFLAAGGPARDPHDLDRDGDGLACEWGPEARRLSVQPAASPRRAARASATSTAPRPSSGRTCFTGPRGGTYTITASGNRNCDGC